MSRPSAALPALMVFAPVFARVFAIVFAMVLAMGLPTIARAAEAIHESLEVHPGGRLLVELEFGRIEIVSHDLEAVRIEATASGFNSRFHDFQLETTPDGVHLTGELGFWHVGFLPDPDIVVRAWVPRAYSLDLHSARGGVAVSGIDGDVTAETSRGSIELDHVQGNASLQTSRGELTIRALDGNLEASTSRGAVAIGNVSGSVDVETSRGSIDVSGVGGSLHVRTSRGSIDIRDTRGEIDAVTSRGPISLHAVESRVSARTSRGAIFASFVGDPAGELESSHGSIRVVIPKSAGVDLDAETSSARIDIGDSIAVVGDRGNDHVVAQLNGGGGELRLRTSHGEIQVRSD